jgi:AmmeMemoRadiSam system protein B
LTSCSTLIRVNDIPHLSEHSLEVLLPMIKSCFPAAKIVPILMAGARPVLSSGLANALRIVFEDYMEESLIVISSNASRNSEAAKALSMAEEFGGLLEKMDSKALLKSLAGGRVSASGGGLAAALLESGLLDGRHFSALCPLAHGIGENGETVYYGAYIA